MSKATQLAPGEPAGWVDWGILALRQRSFEVASQRLEHARQLTPQDDRVLYLLGLLASEHGDSTRAISYLRQAVRSNPTNVKAIYGLALELERQGDQESEAQFEQLIQQIVGQQPDNLAALLELARVAAKQSDSLLLHRTVARIATQSAEWPIEARQQLSALQSAAATDPRSAAIRTAFLRNVLARVPAYRQSLTEIKAPPGEEAQPFTRFVNLPSPPSTPAPPDLGLSFSTRSLPNPDHERWDLIEPFPLSGEGVPAIAEANGSIVKLSTGATFPFPGGAAKTPPSPEGVLPVDFNYDFKVDLVLAGAGGVRLMRQDSPAHFSDVSQSTKLPASVLRGRYTGAWAVDVEADGDMDVVLGSKEGPPVVLRNNGDGSFATVHPFSAISGVSQFVWADLDGDGNPDAALIDGAGYLHVFHNERSGNFVENTVPSGIGRIKALAVADLTHDGTLDLLCVAADGRIRGLSMASEQHTWKVLELATVPNALVLLAGDVRLRVADLDNNGAVDLLLASVHPPQIPSGAAIWLGDQKGRFELLHDVPVPSVVFDTADLRGSGRLDLLGLSQDGQPIQSINAGTANYHWQTLRPRARQTTGDQRINPFGIGGEIEIRSGLLVQKQVITGPQLHFGLGTQTSADVARIAWPNGSVRAEFALKSDQDVITEQRLKGSCPFLFAFNGKRMAFVKDAVPWGSAIGLRIDALSSADIAATEEWYKIGRDQLQASNGFYDLRITGELWETYYYDYLSLMAVDHPANTEVYVDERFTVPSVKLAVTQTSTTHPIHQAIDDNGRDVTSIVNSLDGIYLDNFGRGQYQGITRDHYVEVDLGVDAPTDKPLWLIAQGWLHPSDSSINVAISQGRHDQPKPLSLEIQDERGTWRVAKGNLGFPAGRKKICLINLTGLFRPGIPHRLRLRTNLEIYWDSIEWATELPGAPLTLTKLTPEVAELRYRGFSALSQANTSSPELPDYDHLAATTQIWHDLPGYYTRYGDVRELLCKIDDRYVIMNAGDEMSLRFKVPKPPQSGWVRDFVIAGDGWIKDGDYNTALSQSVLPLPHHSQVRYDHAPRTLEDDWVYNHHSSDWQNYHTRYIASRSFHDELYGLAHQ
ncbi:MAG TPA: FG-GAP-like repeat-containing protein [Acidisarcina sp.]